MTVIQASTTRLKRGTSDGDSAFKLSLIGCIFLLVITFKGLFTSWATLLLIGLALLTMMVGQSELPRFGSLTVASGALFISLLLVHVSQTQMWSRAIDWSLAVLSLCVASLWPWRRSQFLAALTGATLGSSIIAIGTVISWRNDYRVARFLIPNMTDRFYELVERRYSFPGLDPNFAAISLTLGIGCALHLVRVRKGVIRLISVVIVPINAGALLLTGSRGGFLALASLLLVGFVTGSRLGIWKAIGALAVVVFSVRLGGVRLRSLEFDLSSGTGLSRIENARGALSTFGRNALLGGGDDRFLNDAAGGLRFAAHNAFVSVVGTFGAVGAILLSFLVVPPIWSTLRNCYEIPDRRFVYSVLAWVCTSGMSISTETRREWWAGLILIIALGRASQHDRRSLT